MPSSRPEKIAQIKELLSQKQQAFTDKNNFMEKRKSSEQELLTLQQQLEEKIRRFHRRNRGINADGTTREATPSHENLNRKIQEKKEDLQNIDRQMDALGNDLEHTIHTLELELVELVLESFPEEGVAYKEMQEEIKHQEQLQETLEYTLTTCEGIGQLLGTALAIYQARKKRGILSYIFGKNPVHSVNRHLVATSSRTEQALDAIFDDPHSPQPITLQKRPMPPALNEAYEKLQPFLKKLLGKWKSDWLSDSFEEESTLLLEELTSILDPIQLEVKGIKTEKEKLQEKANQWLDQW